MPECIECGRPAQYIYRGTVYCRWDFLRAYYGLVGATNLWWCETEGFTVNEAILIAHLI